MHTPCARAVVCRYSPHPRVLTLLLLLLLLCCTAGCLAAGHHRCMHDKMVQRSEQMAVVREIPRKGQGAVQAYTASAAITEEEKDKLNWTPIRIKAFTRDLNDPKKYCTGIGEVIWNPGFDRIVCTASGILTVRKKRIILEQALPAAIKMHAERISVVRETGIVKVPREDIGHCSGFHIPEEHHTIGLQDADMHLYVAALQCRSESAWAIACGHLKTNGRPFIAAVNLDPRRVEPTSSYVRVVAHEIGHALGFDSAMFPRLGMMGTFFGVRGREFVWMINVSKAKEVARKYFNCPTAEGLEMESTGWGSASHFSIRVAKGDMMGPGYSPLVYSELSLAVFDSMPFYKANFDKAEPLVWGKNAGCDFLEKKCLENGVSPNPEIFCNRSRSSDMYFCTPDRMGLGYCTLKTYYRALPEPFQYFKDKRVGGDLRALDYCPYVEAYSDTTCTSGFHLQSRGSFIGENARCVKGVELEISGKSVGDVCVNTKCDNGKLSVQFLGDDDDEWHVCEEKKEIIPNKENWSGKIICPRYDAVCTKLPDITIPLKELPYQDGDYKPAPGNITWNKTETPSSDPLPHPAPEPTMETVGAPHVEKEPSSSYPNVPTDSSGSTDTTTPVQRDVFEKERIDSPTSTAHSETMLDQNEKHHDGLDGSQHGSGSDVLTPQTNSDGNTVERNSDARDNGVANGGGVRSVGSHGDLLTLNIGIGDGSVTPAGHAPLLLLVLASVVAVVVPL